MPTGSFAFLGATRYHGTFNASTNKFTGAGVTGSPTGEHDLEAGGFASSAGQDAVVGNYLQVATAGSSSIDSLGTLQMNDWVILNFKTGSTTETEWMRLAFENTLATVFVGDISQTGFNLGNAQNSCVDIVIPSGHLSSLYALPTGTDMNGGPIPAYTICENKKITIDLDAVLMIKSFYCC